MKSSRRGFLTMLAAAVGAATLDPEKLLWVPGRKLISIPKPVVVPPPAIFALPEWGRIDVIREAFTVAGVTWPGQEPSAHDVAFGSRELDWVLVAWAPPNRCSTADSRQFRRAVTYNLAVELARFYRSPLHPLTMQVANTTKDAWFDAERTAGRGL